MGATNSLLSTHELETPSGTLTGRKETCPTTKKHILTRYTRVPYALPPTGSRRWQKPHPLPQDYTFSKSDGSPGEYTRLGNVCPQPVYGHNSVMLPNKDAAVEEETLYDEDCLFLNIWVPGGKAPEGGWPVQIFLHGGWLQVGNAMQSAPHDPYHLISQMPRIIVAPTYRLNLFGFLSTPSLEAANFGFWDQRLAIEWTHERISHFGGNADNITLGGLSAGAYSTIFQLFYDTLRPDDKRILKRVYLYSNAVGVQPDAVDSEACADQFEDLCTRFDIDSSLSAEQKVERLRRVPYTELVEQILKLKKHTFRASTDGEFVPKTFLRDILDGTFTARLKKHGVSIMLGEVENEEMLYRLVNPASSYATMVQQLNNYYPAPVTDALLASGIYEIPESGADKDEWRDCFAKIVADCQVHATIRGFASSLLETADPLPINKVHRYRICWRAKGLDEWLDPDVGLCHAADVPIWTLSGTRAGYNELDIQRVKEWLAPQVQFLEGKEVNWGTTTATEVRLFEKIGEIQIAPDKLWDNGLKVWECMSKALV
ncbi:carboxylic ester hydrolase-8 [Coleophoma crateriformis]|uniref:Carboxylic ester hydrolase n=1 Tax=Coleophoma crateriformis TaxID=565419 RepID=A0A3D8SNZ0_9HELO|nr:carboxylic ester hydrolase-8 [Coleophoma crateriformis]